MGAESDIEIDVRELVANQLRADGYTVLLEPDASMLPIRLQGWEPDAIAIGKKPNLIVEVVSEGRAKADLLSMIRKAVADIPDWDLRVVFVRDRNSDSGVPVSIVDVKAAIAHSANIADQDTRLALIENWATIEALSRIIDPIDFARPQTPGRIVEQFARRGLITNAEADFLKQMAGLRNRFVHGDLQVAISPSDLQRFRAVLSALVSQPDLGRVSEPQA